MIRVGVFGANGRMGQALLETLRETDDMTASAALVRAGSPRVSQMVSSEAEKGAELYYTDDIKTALDISDVMIDFTLPEGTLKNIEHAIQHAKPMVIGTTGLKHEHHHLMEELAHIAPVVYGTNMSLGINLLNSLVEKTSRALGSDFDCDITEMHHKHKKDLPSGTAITLADHVAKGREQTLLDIGTLRISDAKPEGLQVNHDHEHGEVGITALRGGGIFGDHSVVFASGEEVVTLSHRALNRNVFAKGAVTAARWVAKQSPGLYSMKDVLGL